MDYSRQKKAFRLFGVYFFGIFLAAFLLSFTTIRVSHLRLAKTKHNALVSNLQGMLAPENVEIASDDITGIKTLINKRRDRNQKREAKKAQQAGILSGNLLQAIHPSGSHTLAPATDESTEFGDDGKSSKKFIAQDNDIPAIPVKYSATLDSLGRASIRSTIVDVAKKYLGTRYVWAGKTPKGFDCSGFTAYVMSLYGIQVSSSSRHQAMQGKKKSLDDVERGDLVFFSRYGKGGRISHVALVVDNTPQGVHVIHATSRGIVIDNIHESKYWRPKILFAKDVISM